MSRSVFGGALGRGAFRRKIVYLALIAVLLVPLARLSQPATGASPGRPANPGGILAQKRNAFRLGQANLGKIDPASETIRLASFGLGCVAASILWNQAEEYKMKKDWTRLSAAYQQIAYLQPNNVEVWRFQAHNLSYNISYEIDDYRGRYYWVIRGIDFLEQGLEYNENEPRLLQAVGLFAAQKVGRADERRQYRRLFRADDDFHRRQRVHERDNFLFAREYYREAERVMENPQDLRVLQVSMSPPIFFSHSSMAQMSYAHALEDDHTDALAAAVDEAHRHANIHDPARSTAARQREIDEQFTARILAGWSEGQRMWRALGERQFLSLDGEPYHLADAPRLKTDLAAATTELETVAPGVRERLRDERRAALPADERHALDMSPFDRDQRQRDLAARAENKLIVTAAMIGHAVTGPQAPKARELGDRIMHLQALVNTVDTDREVVNYDYWALRCALEQTADAREARRLVHHAAVEQGEADLLAARRDDAQAFDIWAKLLKQYPTLVEDPTGVLMQEAIHQYENILKQLDEPFPTDFALDKLREKK
ncbi:MAG TPA: hypothetical protein VHZ24_18945 [Pirellulales bacterium]|jgi:hypothetical protein|nr:hypothetical protein [Pirellulales bacterium]